jgi:hypothetical protein
MCMSCKLKGVALPKSTKTLERRNSESPEYSGDDQQS